MAADTYQAPSFKEPAVFSRNTNGPIVRNTVIETDLLVGDAGSTIASGLLEIGDVIKVFKLPPDVKMKGAKLVMQDFDSATSLTVDLAVTNGTTTKYFFKDSTCGRAAAGNTANTVQTSDNGSNGLIFQFGTNPALGFVVPDDNYYVAFIVSAAPAGASTGTDIAVEVEYLGLESAAEAGFNS